MTISFLRTINEMIIDAIMDADSKDIKSKIGTQGFPTESEIDNVKANIAAAVQHARKERLAEKRVAFESYKRSLIDRSHESASQLRSVPEMLSDIVTALNNSASVPKGTLVAFREQGEGGNDEDIRKIWLDLVDLGLVDPDAPK